MKKILIYVCIVSFICLLTAVFLVKLSINSDSRVKYPIYTHIKETEQPIIVTTNPISIPVVTYLSGDYDNPEIKVPKTTTPPYKSGENPLNDVSGEKIVGQREYAQDFIMFFVDSNVVCTLEKGEWKFDNKIRPSDILGEKTYFTYNDKFIKNIVNSVSAPISVKHKKFTGTFSENMKTIATSYDEKTFLATFDLPVEVPEGLNNYSDYNGGEIRFSDDAFFGTNATYNVNFATIIANAYEPFGVTNIFPGGYTRKMLDIPAKVRDYLWGFQASNKISPELYIEVSYQSTCDIDNDGYDETIYFLVSKIGEDDDVEYDYIAEYGHLNMIVCEDKDRVYTIYSDFVPAHLTVDEVKDSKIYDSALYKPTIVDLNDDGIYEIISWIKYGEQKEQIVLICDNGEFIRVK